MHVVICCCFQADTGIAADFWGGFVRLGDLDPERRCMSRIWDRSSSDEGSCWTLASQSVCGLSAPTQSPALVLPTHFSVHEQWFRTTRRIGLFLETFLDFRSTLSLACIYRCQFGNGTWGTTFHCTQNPSDTYNEHFPWGIHSELTFARESRLGSSSMTLRLLLGGSWGALTLLYVVLYHIKETASR